MKKLIEKLPLPLFNLIINLKAVIRRDRGDFKRQHKNALESSVCREYNL